MIRFREEFGCRQTIMYDPVVEIDRKGDKIKIHETVAWHNGIEYHLPDLHTNLTTKVWFCPQTKGYVIGKPKQPGAILVAWPSDMAFNVLRYKPVKTPLHKKLMMFWSKKS